MGIFDSHLHIIDPRFPLVENHGYLPPAFTVRDYIIATDKLSIQGGAVVSGSFQSFDQSYLVDALSKLGKNFVGVTQLPAATLDEELIYLNDRGVRAIRFNLKRGGSESAENLEYVSRRIHDMLGWHVELYVDSRDLSELAELLMRLPKYSIDHLGLSLAGQDYLFQLVEKGAMVKATGFSRLDFDPLETIKQIMRINPNALMFGTDLPSTRAPRPFHISDVQLIRDNFSAEEVEKILFSNALDFYFPLEIEED